MSKTLARLAGAIAVGLVVSACATFGQTGRVTSIDNTILTAQASQFVATDLVEHLKAELGQGQAILELAGAGEGFGSSLETALRSSGYAVTAPGAKGDEGLPIGYVVEPFESGVLVRLILPTLTVGRLYTVEGEQAVPSGPVSIARAQS